jgi:hypothetical protein
MGATSLSSRTAAAILHLVLLLAAARRHGATDYTVGDSAGWTIGPNYLTWSQKYNFTAGDTLGTYVTNATAPPHTDYIFFSKRSLIRLAAGLLLFYLGLIDYTNNLSTMRPPQCSTT